MRQQSHLNNCECQFESFISSKKQNTGRWAHLQGQAECRDYLLHQFYGDVMCQPQLAVVLDFRLSRPPPASLMSPLAFNFEKSNCAMNKSMRCDGVSDMIWHIGDFDVVGRFWAELMWAWLHVQNPKVHRYRLVSSLLWPSMHDSSFMYDLVPYTLANTASMFYARQGMMLCWRMHKLAVWYWCIWIPSLNCFPSYQNLAGSIKYNLLLQAHARQSTSTDTNYKQSKPSKWQKHFTTPQLSLYNISSSSLKLVSVKLIVPLNLPFWFCSEWRAGMQLTVSSLLVGSISVTKLAINSCSRDSFGLSLERCLNVDFSTSLLPPLLLHINLKCLFLHLDLSFIHCDNNYCTTRHRRNLVLATVSVCIEISYCIIADRQENFPDFRNGIQIRHCTRYRRQVDRESMNIWGRCGLCKTKTYFVYTPVSTIEVKVSTSSLPLLFLTVKSAACKEVTCIDTCKVFDVII